MSAKPNINTLSVEEYLNTERKAEYKSEFFKGEIFAMAGASDNHNTITSNLNILIGGFLWKKDCRTYNSDMRLHIPLNGLYTYPDFMVVCGKKEFLDEQHLDTILNPIIIIEVLSASTEKYDRGDKFRLYRNIPSLREYFMISSEKIYSVEKYSRTDNHFWEFSDSSDIENGSISLDSIGYELKLKDVYEGIVEMK